MFLFLVSDLIFSVSSGARDVINRHDNNEMFRPLLDRAAIMKSKRAKTLLEVSCITYCEWYEQNRHSGDVYVSQAIYLNASSPIQNLRDRRVATMRGQK